jgi:hypothetical protein
MNIYDHRAHAPGLSVPLRGRDISSGLKGGVHASPAEIASAALDAEELSEDAFVRGEPRARSEAERLLYAIHVDSAFAPPIQGELGVVWSTLIGAKLRACLDPSAVPRELDASELERWLLALVRHTDRRDHELFERIGAEDDERGLVVYTKNWYASTHGFTTQLISILQRANGNAGLKPVFLSLLENLREEFCDEAHPELRARWPRRLGVEYSARGAMTDDDCVTEAFGLQNYRTGVANLSDPLLAIGSFFTIEAVFSGVCRRLYPTLVRRGFDADSIATFALHADGDETHAQEMLAAFRQCDLDGRARARVLLGALAQLRARAQMFDAMRQKLGHPRAEGPETVGRAEMDGGSS